MNRQGQAGMILPALLILVLIGALAYSFGRLERTLSSQTRQQQATVEALAKAREILRNHAHVYHLNHPGQSFGFLPCPDIDNDGASETCGGAGISAIGRFPYRTLGTPALRDGHGECLWYVVAGDFKNNPKVSGNFNWDTPGQFIIRSPTNMPLHAIDRGPHYAAALIIAPGRPTSAQNRTYSGTGCHGKADASLAMTAFLEGGYSLSGSGPINITQGTPGGDANNDQIAWIAASDIFDATLIERGEFKTKLDQLFTHLKTLDSSTESLGPAESNLIDGVEVGLRGYLPPGAFTGNVMPHWANQFRYLRCVDNTDCMSASFTSGPLKTCKGLFLFSGSATSSQNRSTSDSDENYFESNFAALVSPRSVVFHGAEEYSTLTPSQDVLVCLS